MQCQDAGFEAFVSASLQCQDAELEAASQYHCNVKMRGSKPASQHHRNVKTWGSKPASQHHCNVKTQSSNWILMAKCGAQARVSTVEEPCVSVITALITGSITAHVMRELTPLWRVFRGQFYPWDPYKLLSLLLGSFWIELKNFDQNF